MLGKSRDGVIGRQLQLERSFRQNPALREKYGAIMREYVQLGHMHCVSTDEDELVEHVSAAITFRITLCTKKTVQPLSSGSFLMLPGKHRTASR